MIVLGIDPGVSGGIAVVSGDAGRPHVIDVWDVPRVGVGAAERVDVVQTICLIRKHAPSFAVIERAQAMPDQGGSSGFKYGRAVGHLEACVQGLLIPMQVIEAGAWKKAHGLLRSEKEASRQRALQLFPDVAGRLARKIDHNRAEAILIAHYGWLIAPKPLPVDSGGQLSTGLPAVLMRA